MNGDSVFCSESTLSVSVSGCLSECLDLSRCLDLFGRLSATFSNGEAERLRPSPAVSPL